MGCGTERKGKGKERQGKGKGGTYIRPRPVSVAVHALLKRAGGFCHGGVLGFHGFRGGQVGTCRVGDYVLDPLREGEVGGGGRCCGGGRGGGEGAGGEGGQGGEEEG